MSILNDISEAHRQLCTCTKRLCSQFKKIKIKKTDIKIFNPITRTLVNLLLETATLTLVRKPN